MAEPQPPTQLTDRTAARARLDAAVRRLGQALDRLDQTVAQRLEAARLEQLSLQQAVERAEAEHVALSHVHEQAARQLDETVTRLKGLIGG